MTENAKLYEFDADEWYDNALKFRRMSREDFDALWQRFQREKAERQRRMGLQ